MKKIYLFVLIMISISITACLEDKEVTFLERLPAVNDGDSSLPSSASCSGHTASSYNDVGSGTLVAPYILCNETQLLDFATNGCGNLGSTACTQHFKLGNNISLVGNWTPIGLMNTVAGTFNNGEVFEGTFDGDFYYIENLTIPASANRFQGMFHALNTTAVVSNLELRSVNISGGGYVASLAAYSSGTIDNVKVSGTVTSTQEVLGGLAGFNAAIIRNSSFTGTVTNTGTSSGVNVLTGGFVGYTNDSADHRNNFTNAVVSSTHTNASNIGGFVGYALQSSFRNSYAEGSVTASSGASSNAAGFGGTIIGDNNDAIGTEHDDTLEDCYSASAVTAGGTAVGLISTSHQALNMNNNHFSGTLTAPTVYGIFNHSPLLNNHSNNFWNSTTSGTTNFGPNTFGDDPTGKFTHLTSAQMLVQGSFTGWNFSSVWTMGTSYPENTSIGPNF